MAAKEVYNIRDSLDKSFLDIEIAISNKDGMGLKPLPVRFILAVIVSGFICFYMVSNTFISSGGPVGIALFILVWALMSILLLKPDKSGDMAIFRIPTLVNYLPASARKADTRSSSYIGPFHSVSNIDHVEEEEGIVVFNDGGLGLVFSVVGNASCLLFESDRDSIISRMDTFFRTMRQDYEFIFITSKEAQNVVRQVNAMHERARNEIDPELRELIEFERDYMDQHVGSQYRSIHQYLIIRADNREALAAARNRLQVEVEGSTLIFKRCTALYDGELERVFSGVFKGKESV